MTWLRRWLKKRPAILVIEDNEEIGRLLSMFLQSKGFRVRHMKNGFAGLESLQKDVPDMILLDITMPKMNGFDVLLKIKSDPNTKAVPVVMCTDHSSMQDVERCCQWGADGYVLKPFNLERVLEKVNAVLGVSE